MRLSLVTSTALLVLSTFGLLACEKSSSPGDIAPAPPKEPAPATSSLAATAQPSTAAVADSGATAAGAAGAVATGVSTLGASADGGKPKDGSSASPQSGTVGALKPVSKHVAGKNFTLDLASPGCKATSECAMTIKLVAAADYHVNKEYPYKFIANAAPNVAFLGKGEATTFSRAAGDFVEQGEKAGTMTVRFRPSSQGDAQIAGTYKFSVCSADQCQIEQEKVDLTVPVM
jgi:hypothetical protein